MLLLHIEGSGFRIPALPKAEFDRLTWSGLIGSPLRGRGEDSAGVRTDCHISQHLGCLQSRFLGEKIWLEEGVCLSGLLGGGVYTVNLKANSNMGNWRKREVIAYQIGRNIRNKCRNKTLSASIILMGRQNQLEFYEKKKRIPAFICESRHNALDLVPLSQCKHAVDISLRLIRPDYGRDVDPGTFRASGVP